MTSSPADKSVPGFKMDDCDLETLSVKPGKLTPAFKRDITEYHVTVTSDVKEITFECFTSDTNACKSISGSDGGRSVPLKEGVVNDIKIEVTAEDGTTKNYFVYVKRLSASDATLTGLKVSSGALEPGFASEEYEYFCTVSCDTQELTVTPVVPDKRSAVQVNGSPADTAVNLNIGDTVVDITVASPDGSKTQVYKITFTRKQIPRFIKVSDPALAFQYEDPVSLSVIHRPITILGSKHSFSAQIIDEYTKTSKVNPLDDSPLDAGWRVEDYDLDAKISTSTGSVLLAKGNWSEAAKISEVGAEVKKSGCQEVKPSADIKYDTNCPVIHKVETRKWETALQQICNETDITKLSSSADDYIQKYLSSLPKPGWNQGQAKKGESPLDHLQRAIYCCATAVRSKPKDASLHLRLGALLEERYLAEDLYGLKPTDDDSSDTHAGTDMAAQESSKEEECQAICQLRGVGPGSPLSLQLKAIDEEYHHLLEAKQGGKADHVQGLFLWKSKQATQEGAAASKVSDDETVLGQAYLKYLDALSLDESKGQHHFQVGRMLVIQGQYNDAVPRLEAALGWLPSLTMAKFYLAFALSLREGGAGTRAEEVINLLQDTMESLLVKNSEEAVSEEASSWKMKNTLTSDLLRSSNVHLLRGIIQLSKLLKAHPSVKDTMKCTDALHTAALVAAQVLPTLHRGDTYQQVEWVLMEAHSALLDHLLETAKDQEAVIARRCQRLSALIKHSTIPQNAELTGLQQRTIERLVTIEPCSSQALCLLGDVQLQQYDANPEGPDAQTFLSDAKKSFQASIALEGKPQTGSPPEDLTAQKWWQDKLKKEEEKKAAAAAAAAPKPAAGRGAAGPARGAARGATAAGRGAARGAAAPRGAARGAPAPAARGARGAGTAGRGIPPGRGGAKTAAPPAKPAPGPKLRSMPKAALQPVEPKSMPKAALKPVDNKSPGAKQPPAPAKAAAAPAAKEATEEKPKEEKPAETPAPVNPNAPINQKAYLPRLGLARALAKTDDNLEECKKYYNEVIDMAPQVHDAYRESADLLSQKDPLAAVDIYAKFPVPDQPSFDDAYIFGEIVHLLMKCEKYDDARLVPNMIKMGQIMGVGYIDKYVRKLEDKFKYEPLKATFAGIHGKSIDDPNMVSFFKMKFWN